MSIVLILFPMYRGNLFDFLQFDNAVFLSAFRCKGCFHICCPIQINIPIKCSIRCRCYQIYKLIDNIVADSATTKINKAVQSGTDTLYIQSFRIAFFLWNFIKCFLKFLDFFISSLEISPSALIAIKLVSLLFALSNFACIVTVSD